MVGNRSPPCVLRRGGQFVPGPVVTLGQVGVLRFRSGVTGWKDERTGLLQGVRGKGEASRVPRSGGFPIVPPCRNLTIAIGECSAIGIQLRVRRRWRPRPDRVESDTQAFQEPLELVLFAERLGALHLLAALGAELRVDGPAAQDEGAPFDPLRGLGLFGFIGFFRRLWLRIEVAESVGEMAAVDSCNAIAYEFSRVLNRADFTTTGRI